jgi:hypothetical protein
MKLFSTKKQTQIREQIDAIRLNYNLKGFEKWRDIAEVVVRDLKCNGKFFDTPQGQFFVDKSVQRSFPLCKAVELSAIVTARYGINPKEHGFDRVLADLQTEAHLYGEKIECRKLAH